jgi:hypothetical protein
MLPTLRQSRQEAWTRARPAHALHTHPTTMARMSGTWTATSCTSFVAENTSLARKMSKVLHHPSQMLEAIGKCLSQEAAVHLAHSAALRPEEEGQWEVRIP